MIVMILKRGLQRDFQLSWGLRGGKHFLILHSYRVGNSSLRLYDIMADLELTA